jgi:hypothetical protein
MALFPMTIDSLLRRLAVALLGTVMSAVPSWASSTIHVGSGAGTACATGGCPVYNGETNNFGNSGIDLYQNSGGAPDLVDSALLILAVPNDTASGSLTGAGSSTITGASLFDPYPGGTPAALSIAFGSTSFGLNGNGFEGLMSSGDIYGFLGLSGNNSNNMANLTTWDLAVDHITATDFGIYVYALNTSSFGGQDLIDIGLAGLPEGTFAVGYGEDANGKSYDTPFTEAGFNDTPVPVPEPRTIMLFGAGLLFLGFIRRRRAGKIVQS